jgi:hypothetical protein
VAVVLALAAAVSVHAQPGPRCSPKTIDEARAEAKQEHWAKALALGERVLACTPSDPTATFLSALAACNLKDCPRAKKYVGRLSGAKQSMARQSCLRNGFDPSSC